MQSPIAKHRVNYTKEQYLPSHWRLINESWGKLFASCSSSVALNPDDTVNAMFDCPLQKKTSPNKILERVACSPIEEVIIIV